MKNKTYTNVTASEEFWQLQLTKQIINKSDSEIKRINGAEIQIESINCSAGHDILQLSSRYPEQIFKASYSKEDPFENLVTTYHYLNGTEVFVKQEYQYYFEIDHEDRDLLDPKFCKRFQDRVLEYFEQIDNYRVRTSVNDPSFIEFPVKPVAGDLTHIVEMEELGVKLSARRFGLTYLDVTVHHSNMKTRKPFDYEGHGDFDGFGSWLKTWNYNNK